MKITLRSFAILSALLMWGCSSSEFTADKRSKDGDKNSKDSTSEDDDERASEPVPVGGAYLSCQYAVVQNAADGDVYVGCGVYQDVLALAEQKRIKLDAQQNAIEWNIVDGSGKAVKNAIYKDVPESDKYHRIYEYRGTSFKSYTISVVVKNKSGERIDLEKPTYDMGSVDTAFGVIAVQYRLWPEVGPLRVATCRNLEGCQTSDDIVGIEQNFADMFRVTDFCKSNGKINENQVIANFGAGSLQTQMSASQIDIEFSPQASMLTSGAICFINNYDEKLYKVSNGCFVVPWFYNNAVHFGVFNEGSNRADLQELQTMRTQFACSARKVTAASISSRTSKSR